MENRIYDIRCEKVKVEFGVLWERDIDDIREYGATAENFKIYLVEEKKTNDTVIIRPRNRLSDALRDDKFIPQK